MSESILTLLQHDLAARLAACDYFADIPILTEQRGAITDGMNKALGSLTVKEGKSGAFVQLLQPSATVLTPNLSSPLLKADLTVRVMENVVLNTSPQGTGKAALSIAAAVLNYLHHYQPGGLAQILTAEHPSLVPVKDPAATLAYDVHFTTQVADPGGEPKVATPVISPASGRPPQEVTLSCETLGAILFYSKSGSPPYPGCPGVLTYEVPFIVQSPSMLRVCAIKPGYIPSDTSYAHYD